MRGRFVNFFFLSLICVIVGLAVVICRAQQDSDFFSTWRPNSDTRGLDFTIGHRPNVPASLEDALGRAIAGDEPQQCFGCHSTGAVEGMQLKLDQLKPGIGCEACHGPGEKHLVAMKANNLDEPQIFNPRGLGGSELSQSFCGTCHTSFEQAMLLPASRALTTSGFNRIACSIAAVITRTIRASVVWRAQPARAPAKGCGLLRSEVSRVSSHDRERSEDRAAQRAGMSGEYKELCDLSHAENRARRHACQLHRPLDPHGQTERTHASVISAVNLDPVVTHFRNDADAIVAGEDNV